MNQIKVFVAIMFTVGMMQLHASEQPWELRRNLACEIDNFQQIILEPAIAWETSVMKACLSCCIRDKDREKELEFVDSSLTYFKYKLQNSMPIHDLYEIAKSESWMLPNPYANTAEYEPIRDACQKIIDKKIP